jgi:hypothetical protein
VLPGDVRRDQVAARRQRVDQRRDDPRGLELVGDEVQDRDQHQRDRLAEVQDLPDRRIGQDRLRVSQIGMDVGRAALGRAGQQLAGVPENERVVVGVDDAR